MQPNKRRHRCGLIKEKRFLACLLVLICSPFCGGLAIASDFLQGSVDNAYMFYGMTKICASQIVISPEAEQALKAEVSKLEQASKLDAAALEKKKAAVAELLKATYGMASGPEINESCGRVQGLVTQYEAELGADNIFPDSTEKNQNDAVSPPATSLDHSADADQRAASKPKPDLSRLPIPDAKYVMSDKECGMLRKGTLDFVQLSVENNGASYSLPEATCVVTKVSTESDNVYAVTGDCREVDQVWKHQFFLTVNGNGHISLDGKPLQQCVEQNDTATVNQLIDRWTDDEISCRGGDPEQKATLKACGDRNDVIAQLNARNWCYGKEGQSLAEYVWHQCQADSIRNAQ